MLNCRRRARRDEEILQAARFAVIGCDLKLNSEDVTAQLDQGF